jgi:hypothetical protein
MFENKVHPSGFGAALDRDWVGCASRVVAAAGSPSYCWPGSSTPALTFLHPPLVRRGSAAAQDHRLAGPRQCRRARHGHELVASAKTGRVLRLQRLAGLGAGG